MMNLHLLVLLTALFMTIARPNPIEFNAELDPIPYNDRVLQNLGMVQKGPTLENSNIAYTGTTVPSSVDTAQIPHQLPSSFDWDSPFHLADNAPVKNPEAQSRDGSEDAHCCEEKKGSGSVVGCKCVQSEKDRGRQLGGESDGQSDGHSDSQSDRQSGRQEEGNRQEDNDSRPGIWQLYVEPWMCEHILLNNC